MRLPTLGFALGITLGTSPHAAGMGALWTVLAVHAVPPAAVRSAVESARGLAAARLGAAACRGIFEELPDFTGRPVARRLESAERSPSAAFARLLFVPSADGPCTSACVAAWSVAGDVRVRVCGGTFAAVAGRDPREAAAILIHEALHTRGVAEGAAHEPLTDFVRRRCGL